MDLMRTFQLRLLGLFYGRENRHEARRFHYTADDVFFFGRSESINNVSPLSDPEYRRLRSGSVGSKT